MKLRELALDLFRQSFLRWFNAVDYSLLGSLNIVNNFLSSSSSSSLCAFRKPDLLMSASRSASTYIVSHPLAQVVYVSQTLARYKLSSKASFIMPYCSLTKKVVRNYPSFHILFFRSDVGNTDSIQSKYLKDKIIGLGIGSC